MKHWLLGAALIAVWQGFAAAPELTAVADPLESYYPVQGRIAGTPKIHLNLFHREFGLAALSLYNPTQTTMYCRITAYRTLTSPHRSKRARTFSKTLWLSSGREA